MSRRFANRDPLTRELALAEVVFGLPPAEREERASRIDVRQLEELELLVAAVHLAGLAGLAEFEGRGCLENPPAHLVRRIEQDARAWLAASSAG